VDPEDMVTWLLLVDVVGPGVILGELVTGTVGLAVGLLLVGLPKFIAPENTRTVGTRIMIIRTTANAAKSFLRDFGDGGGGGGGGGRISIFSLIFRVILSPNMLSPFFSRKLNSPSV
jgi:hypothetical protein